MELIHNSLLRVLIKSQINPVHALSLKIRHIPPPVSNYVSVFRMVPYLHVSPPKLCMYLSSSPYVPDTPSISPTVIWSPE